MTSLIRIFLNCFFSPEFLNSEGWLKGFKFSVRFRGRVKLRASVRFRVSLRVRFRVRVRLRFRVSVRTLAKF